jgi:hypothetical protein
MEDSELKGEFDAGGELRARLGNPDDGAPSAGHDRTVLTAASSAAGRIRSRRRFRLSGLGLAVPVAASFVLGSVAMRLVDRSLPAAPVAPAQVEALRIPLRVATRDAPATGEEIPVEQADPQLWYRYIQELVYAGDRVQAERHLRRFNQLHPDFAYRP